MKINLLLVGVAFGFICSSALAQPVLRHTFDEASGNALDLGTAPLTEGVLMGGATRSSDTPSGAGSSLDLRTDGPYAHMLSGDAADLDGVTALTLTTWLKVETYLAGNNRLLSKQAATGNFDGFTFNMNAQPNDGVVGPDDFRLGLFLGGSDGFAFAFSDADVDATQWTFVAATWDSVSGEVMYYTGGANTAVTQLGTTQFVFAGTLDGMTAPFGVGYTDAAPAADTSVQGWQDDVRVYNTRLDLAALDAVRLENLQSAPGFDADFNGDQKVDGADYAAWTGGFGTAAGATKAQGDANADMKVDGADFLVWQQETGTGVTGAGAAVPEPATGGAVALLTATCAAASRRWSRR